MSSVCPPSACDACATSRGRLERLGLKLEKWDHVVALAGNPNTGKSTVFNRLTGLRQHTGNWPGKTIARAEGGFAYNNRRYKIVDLPGTYSLRSASPDETVAREFLLFGRPDVTVIVADANALERNLNLALQILQITDRAVLCLNRMDEARANDSPRERLIAILTNNFALCNGRWPTQILIATIFLGALAPPALAGFTATAAVFGVATLGLALTLASSWLLSRTVLPLAFGFIVCALVALVWRWVA